MNRVMILGATNYSFMISDFIRQEGKAEVVAHTVDAKDVGKYQQACSERGLKLVPFEELSGADDVKIINAVGYTKMNSIRAIVSEKIKNAGLQVADYISTRAIVLPENLVGGGYRQHRISECIHRLWRSTGFQQCHLCRRSGNSRCGVWR